MYRENYGKILEAADAVQSMKQFARSIEQNLSSIAKDGEQPSKQAHNLDVDEDKKAELDMLIDGIVKCPIAAWKLFRSGKLIESIDMCSASLQTLKSRQDLISTVMSSQLMACTELQIINAQARIRKGATELLTGPVGSINELGLDRLRAALLVHSGLHSKTHHTEDDLRKALLKVWSELPRETSDEALRSAVLKDVQLFAFALVLGFKHQEAASVFNKHANVFAESATKQQLCIIDKALLEAQNSSSLAKLEGTICELSIGIFCRWLNLLWDSISSSSPSSDLAILNFVLSFQRSYNLESDGIWFKQRAALVREQVEAKIGDNKVSFLDEFNLLLPCLHPEIHSLPPKYNHLLLFAMINLAVGSASMTVGQNSG